MTKRAMLALECVACGARFDSPHPIFRHCPTCARAVYERVSSIADAAERLESVHYVMVLVVGGEPFVMSSMPTLQAAQVVLAGLEKMTEGGAPIVISVESERDA